jgi:hypothetical protein
MNLHVNEFAPGDWDVDVISISLKMPVPPWAGQTGRESALPPWALRTNEGRSGKGYHFFDSNEQVLEPDESSALIHSK